MYFALLEYYTTCVCNFIPVKLWYFLQPKPALLSMNKGPQVSNAVALELTDFFLLNFPDVSTVEGHIQLYHHDYSQHPKLAHGRFCGEGPIPM